MGEEQVFLDHRSIEPGEPWPDRLEEAVREAAVVLVLLGRDWLRLREEDSGLRLIDRPDDWVRRELETAFESDRVVVPIRVELDGVELEERYFANLPSLAPLATLQALPLRRAEWERDVKDLLVVLEERGLQVAHAPAASQRAAETASAEPRSLPQPPDLRAVPDYIGSHAFVGRLAELDTLDDWADAANPHALLLFEAIGGAGKSILTWHWTRQCATAVRTDWAGRFWYSFYERGSRMTEFCRHALAYMTGAPMEDLRKRELADLADDLVAELHSRPWLLVLDGLERILVNYNRIDAEALPDEAADEPVDDIAGRDPCGSIDPIDDELLRRLANAQPSKVLVSTRLTPSALLNPGRRPIPGVQRESLSGLRPADAEHLLRSCGIEGNSAQIRSFLSHTCDCHPLVVGVLGGLIRDYLPARGDFDDWLQAPTGGGSLDLGHLDLVARRNHVLQAALEAVPDAGRDLLSVLSLLDDAVDYTVLCAIAPDTSPSGQGGSRLSDTVRDLERRGLLQYDTASRQHDMHPVVRSVVLARLGPGERERFGQQALDFFSSRADRPYDQVEALGDLRNVMNSIRTLVRIGRMQAACDAFRAGLSDCLLFDLEAYSEVLSLVRPFFERGWGQAPLSLSWPSSGLLCSSVTIALSNLGMHSESLELNCTRVRLDHSHERWAGLHSSLDGVGSELSFLNHLASRARLHELAGRLARALGSNIALFISLLRRLRIHMISGAREEAERALEELESTNRNWPRGQYRPGQVELIFAEHLYLTGRLSKQVLLDAERVAEAGRSRLVRRGLQHLSGWFAMNRGDWEGAAKALHGASRLARQSRVPDPCADAGLVLARHHLGDLQDARGSAELVSSSHGPAQHWLAELWLAIGDPVRALQHAKRALRWAWADGEPWVRRFELDRARELFERMGEEPPELPPFDPEKVRRFDWEPEVERAIERLEAKNAAKD